MHPRDAMLAEDSASIGERSMSLGKQNAWQVAPFAMYALPCAQYPLAFAILRRPGATEHAALASSRAR